EGSARCLWDLHFDGPTKCDVSLNARECGIPAHHVVRLGQDRPYLVGRGVDISCNRASHAEGGAGLHGLDRRRGHRASIDRERPVPLLPVSQFASWPCCGRRWAAWPGSVHRCCWTWRGGTESARGREPCPS